MEWGGHGVGGPWYESTVTSTPRDPADRAAPMAPAPFVWREDGRPDWGAMWTTFCELALHGGPPHRGAAQALRGAQASGDGATADAAVMAEIRRGIWETTRLYSEPSAPGWIALTCESRGMAVWLGAAIVLENVEARVDGDRLLLPAGPRFRLEDEIKSVITVVAKTHHFGSIHGGAAREPDPRDGATTRLGFRCTSCGLDVQVSRPEVTADLDATCPVDGAPMARQGPVTAPRPPGPLRVGIAGPADARSTLIDALRRRYGRRRVVVAAAQPGEVIDHAVDLVLVEAGDDGQAAGVDATIVVGTAGAATDDRARLDQDTSRRPVVLVDLVAAEGVDVVTSWLERELRFTPWKSRR
jgi:hypothetical protein